MNVSSIKLTHHQTSLLLALHLAADPNAAKLIAHKNARSAASLKVLQQLNMVVVGENGISVTDIGIHELTVGGYIDNVGNTTEFGQEYYQKAVHTLNEFMLAQSLLSMDFK